MLFNILALSVLSATSVSPYALAASDEASERMQARENEPRALQGYGPPPAPGISTKGLSSSISISSKAFQPSKSSSSSLSKASQPSQPPCPAVWKSVAADLRADFGTTCSQDASNAVRFAFHDAGGYSALTTPYGPASGGADGSILLNQQEAFRSVSNPTQGYRRFLLGVYNKYKAQGVGAADLVQFAGNLGVASCSGGPILKTVVGRTDDATASPVGLLPQPFGAGAAHDVLIKLFADKGFTPRELAALMGAHSISRAFVQTPNGIAQNSPQDTTPTQWDMLYYSQTQAKVAPKGVGRFDSDINLANSSTTSGKAYTEFANNRDAWVTAFSAAMFKLSVLGIPAEKVKGFADCTALIKG